MHLSRAVSVARLVAVERMREGVAGLAIEHADGAFGALTISAGVSVLDPNEIKSVAQVLKETDEALYVAKQLGRNRVERAVPQPV